MLELINARLIEENDSVLIVVYAVNQKGKSAGVVIRDLELGATVRVDKGRGRTTVERPAISAALVFFPSFFNRKLGCRNLSRLLHAILHRHRDNHPRRVPSNRIQNDFHLLGGEVVKAATSLHNHHHIAQRAERNDKTNESFE